MTTSPARAGASPEADFRQLYASSYGDVLRFVQRRCHPSHAEDVAAEVFLVAWRRYADLPADADGRRAWLFGVAHKTLANARRGQARREALAVRIQDVSTGVDPGTHPDLVATRLDLHRAWQHLSPLHQETLSLAIWDGLSSEQAGELLGISATAYRLRLSRARRALRTQMTTSDLAPAATGRALPEGDLR